MKAFITVVIILLSVSPIFAQDISYKASSVTYKSDQIENSLNHKLSLGYKDINLWATKETPRIFGGGQQVFDVDLYGAGLGYKTTILSQPFFLLKRNLQVNFYADGGWYFPDIHILDAFHLDGAELMFCHALNLPLGDKHYVFWKNYDVELHGGIGGTIGLDGKIDLTKHLSMGAGVGYRFLRLDQMVTGWNGEYDRNEPHWEIGGPLDFSGVLMGVFVKYTY